MDLHQYQLTRQKQLEQAWQPRPCCPNCKNPRPICYCSKVRPFASSLTFVILIHRGEARRSIATGRMAHLILSNSYLFEGLNYSDDRRINALIEDPENFPVVLYPGEDSMNLSQMDPIARQSFFPKDKKPVVFILDGTWNYAKRMKRVSRNLNKLPMIQFTPKTPSNFRVRKQPNDFCYSTIEAVHELSRLMDVDSPDSRANLLEVFDYLVNEQIRCQIRNGFMGRRNIVV